VGQRKKASGAAVHWSAIRGYAQSVFTPGDLYQTRSHHGVWVDEPRVDGMDEVAYVVSPAAYDPRLATQGWREMPLMRWLCVQAPRQAPLDNARFRDGVRSALAAGNTMRIVEEPIFSLFNMIASDRIGLEFTPLPEQLREILAFFEGDGELPDGSEGSDMEDEDGNEEDEAGDAEGIGGV